MDILKVYGTPASARNSANTLRLRLCGGRLLTQPPGSFKRQPSGDEEALRMATAPLGKML